MKFDNFAYDIPGIRCYAVRRAEEDVTDAK